ncbi:hypothetical protein HDV02_006535, partial [Globomyces sp. JEL0801]
MKTGSFFPGRPYVRQVGEIRLSKENTQLCNHHFKEKGRLGAGTLLYWCGRHRHCIGFTILQSAESSKTVYSTLLSRFKKLPKYIIYDNGCNLYDYILNRSPEYFMDTYVLSDGFHWKNHINCGVTFNAKLYQALQDISTVLHEQKNSWIAKLKKTAVHMNFDTFCEFLVYITHNLNDRELLKLPFNDNTPLPVESDAESDQQIEVNNDDTHEKDLL